MDNKGKRQTQIIVHKTQHRKLKTKQHEPLQKLGVIAGVPEGNAGIIVISIIKVPDIFGSLKKWGLS